MTRDVEITARTAWGEARGEGELGMLAVCWVVVNRANIAAKWLLQHPERQFHPLYGFGTPDSAALRPWQFSCWNRDDPNRAALLAVGPADRAFATACRLAKVAVHREIEDPTNGATHYHTIAAPAAVQIWPPRWAREQEPTTTIGHHVFYRLERG